MIDGHVHLERGPLSVEYAMKFVEEAQRKGIDELQILDHSHRFREFAPFYECMKNCDGQINWLAHDLRNGLDEYFELINKMKKMDLPIKVKFGLEVCYMKDKEDILRDILKDYSFDFLIGSVHAIHHIAYDSEWSLKELWEKYDKDEIYREYFEEMYGLIESDLFTQIGHPDTIKMFNIYPTFDMTPYFDKLAKLANEHHVKVENNVGCYYRYHHKDMGLADEVLKVFKDNGCQMITVSDAHNSFDVGNYIADVWEKTMK